MIAMMEVEKNKIRVSRKNKRMTRWWLMMMNTRSKVTMRVMSEMNTKKKKKKDRMWRGMSRWQGVVRKRPGSRGWKEDCRSRRLDLDDCAMLAGGRSKGSSTSSVSLL